jgi:hypothetical protein
LIKNRPKSDESSSEVIAVLAPTRVARWYIFKQKIQIWVNIGGSCNGRCWYILRRLVYFTAILNILRPFCNTLVHFFPFWYFVPRKIWQPWHLHTTWKTRPLILAVKTDQGPHFPPIIEGVVRSSGFF